MSDMTSSSQDLTGGAGLKIRQAREAQGLEIDALATLIKVPVAKLQALEADDRSVLPDANFNRALAMTVCRALKIDPAPVLALMPAAVAVSLASGKPPLNQPFRDFSHTGLTFEDSTPLSLKVPKLSPAILAPLLLLLLAGGIYLLPEHLDPEAWFRSQFAASKPAAQAASVATEASGIEMASAVVVPVAEAASDVAVEALAVASAPEQPGVAVSSAQLVASQAKGSSAPEARVAAASATVAPQQAASSPKVVTRAVELPVVAASASAASSAASAPTGPIGKLTLTSKEPAWIEVRDALGQRVFSRQLAAGESVDVQGQAPLKVHAGNAPSVSIQFNGRPVDLAAVTRQNVARIELK